MSNPATPAVEPGQRAKVEPPAEYEPWDPVWVFHRGRWCEGEVTAVGWAGLQVRFKVGRGSQVDTVTAERVMRRYPQLELPPLDHAPSLPSWDCQACGEPYVCGEARKELLDHYGGRTNVLGRVLAAMMDQAVRDQPKIKVSQLYDRFLAWAEPPGGYR